MHPCCAALHARTQAPPSHVTASSNWQDGRVAAVAQRPPRARWNCTKGIAGGGQGAGYCLSHMHCQLLGLVRVMSLPLPTLTHCSLQGKEARRHRQ